MIPKVSVIVPVYKVRSYLNQCIDSIINQTLKDIEIILVDDGSFDGESEICDEYASQDSRIKVIHKQNEGLSVARNDGIDLSSAPYIMFVDSDDWVEPRFCELPYEAAVKNDADLVLFYHNRVFSSDNIERVKSNLHEGLLKEEDAFFYNVYVTSCAWIGLYRRELFETARYPAGKYYEDIATSHKLMHAANKIYLVDKALYNHRMGRPNSITTASTTKDHPDKLEMMGKRAQDFCNWGFENCAFNDAFLLLVYNGCKGTNQKPYVDIVRRGKMPEQYNWKQKILLTAFRVSPVLFDAICTVAGKRIK